MAAAIVRIRIDCLLEEFDGSFEALIGVFGKRTLSLNERCLGSRDARLLARSPGRRTLVVACPNLIY